METVVKHFERHGFGYSQDDCRRASLIIKNQARSEARYGQGEGSLDTALLWMFGPENPLIISDIEKFKKVFSLEGEGEPAWLYKTLGATYFAKRMRWHSALIKEIDITWEEVKDDYIEQLKIKIQLQKLFESAKQEWLLQDELTKEAGLFIRLLNKNEKYKEFHRECLENVAQEYSYWYQKYETEYQNETQIEEEKR